MGKNELCFDCEDNKAVSTCPYCHRKSCEDCADDCNGIAFCNDRSCSDTHEKAMHCEHCDEHKCEIDECERCGEKHCTYKDDCICKHIQVGEHSIPPSIEYIDGKKYSYEKVVICDNCDESFSLVGELERLN